jgi:hypothetical protein
MLYPASLAPDAMLHALHAGGRASVGMLGNAEKSAFELAALRSADQKKAAAFLSIDSTPVDLSKTRKKKSAGDDGSSTFPVRRALVLGLLAQPIFFAVSTSLRGTPKLAGSSRGSLAPPKAYDEGDAVTRPGLETKLLELLGGETGVKGGKTVPMLIDELEDYEGSQLNAAAGTGRWVIPWVGGWERVYAGQLDASYLGGPAKPSFSSRGQSFSQVSTRQFIYGPGEGGITIEYLYSAAGAPETAPKLLLTRPGKVTNLGGLQFRLDFDAPLNEYEVLSNVKNAKDGTISDALATGQPLEGGAERAPPMSAMLRTTYLSERLWIIRDVRDADLVSIFVRSETRSVMDRRGLVADGQLKPPEKEEVRYGGLLFGENLSDYSGWDVKEGKDAASKSRLLVR